MWLWSELGEASDREEGTKGETNDEEKEKEKDEEEEE